MAKKYKCPYCNYIGISDKLIQHIDKDHEDMIPEKYTAARLVYNIRNKREYGSCLMCHKATEWNEQNQRYKPFCSNKCHDDYVKRFEKNMIKVHGKARLLDDIDQQQKMLANRHISGKYRFQDGGVLTYTGSYEHKTLEFFDKVLGVKSNELMVPGPTIEYEYNGNTLRWITDIYWIDLNLVIEVKDGGDNPNKRTMTVYREKQLAKETVMTDHGKFNYLRLTNNNFAQLLEVIAEIKKNNLEDNGDKIIRVNESSLLESVLPEVGPVNCMPNGGTSGYIISKGFTGLENPHQDDSNYALANDMISDKIVVKDKNNIPKSVSKDALKDSENLTIYKFKGPKQKFIEVASSKKPIKSFYEALSGHKEYFKNQIDFDPLFEKVDLYKMMNSINDSIASLKEEFDLVRNPALPYLPVMNIDDIKKKKSILKQYEDINIAEDVNGYFLYNIKTGRRSESMKNMDDLRIEHTSVSDLDREVSNWERRSNKELLDAEFDSEADLNQEYINYLSMTKKSRKDSDAESRNLFNKDNEQRYREALHGYLQKPIKVSPISMIDGSRRALSESVSSEDDNTTISDALLNIAERFSKNNNNDNVAKAKEWAAISMRHIVYPTKNLEDLEDLWINYNNQYRKLQREADWKCEELFGMNCESLYNQEKAKFLLQIDSNSNKTQNIRSYDGSNIKPDEKITMNEEFIPAMSKQIYSNELIPGTFTVVSDMPLLTPGEIDDMYGKYPGEVNTPLDEEIRLWQKEYRNVFESNNISSKFKDLNNKRIKALESGKLTEQEYLAYGWPIDIPFTPENRSKANIRLNEYMKFPIEVSDENLKIQLPMTRSIRDQYQDSHELIKIYSKKQNLSQLKYETIKLYHLEKEATRLRNNTSKGTKEYKEITDTRALIKNDISQNLKIILAIDSSFNIRKEYEKSPFYKDSIKIKLSTFENIIKVLKNTI